MTDVLDHEKQNTPGTSACPAPSRRRFLGTGLGAGFLGGVCCIGSAVAVGASIGGLSFFTTLMDRYQIYFVLGSLLMMAFWLVRQIWRARAAGGSTVRAFLRTTWRQLVVMGIIYLVTLGVAMAVVAAVRPMM